MKAYIIPETPLWKLIATALCGLIVGMACIIVYDHLTVNTLAKLSVLEDRVAVLESNARPLVLVDGGTANIFPKSEFRGVESEAGGDLGEEVKGD